MLEVIVTLAFSCIITWVILVVAMLILSRIADFAFPPLKDFLWRTALVVVGANLVTVALALLIHPLLALIGGILVFFALLVKLLDLNLWQAILIGIAIWLIRWLAIIALAIMLR